MNQGCVATLTHVHTSNVNVTVLTAKIGVRPITPYCHVGSGLYSSQQFMTHDSSIMTDSGSYRRSLGHSSQKAKISFRATNLSQVTWMWMMLRTIVVPDIVVVVAGIPEYLSH